MSGTIRAFREQADRWLGRLETAMAVVALAILIAICGSVVAEVVMRYLFNRPLYWVVESSEYALVYITFLGAPWALRMRGHVSVDAFVEKMPARVQSLCAFLSDLIGISVALVIAIFGAFETFDAFSRGLYKPSLLQTPTWIPLLALPIGATVLALRFVLEALDSGEAVLTGRALDRQTTATLD